MLKNLSVVEHAVVAVLSGLGFLGALLFVSPPNRTTYATVLVFTFLSFISSVYYDRRRHKLEEGKNI